MSPPAAPDRPLRGIAFIVVAFACLGVSDALAEIEKQTHARVLIIEDEPIIAMDTATNVRDLGLEVTGITVTRTDAVAPATEERPGLVEADA